MWHILIADDHLVDRRLIREFLKGHAECHEAADGNEAILSYNFSVRDNHPYDLILLDMAMPKIGGAEVLRRIREDEDKRKVPQESRVPAIAISAMSESDINEELDGFSGYVGKPMDPKELVEKIAKVLAKKSR